MLSAGDLQGCLRKLEALLRVIKYPGYVDYNGLSKGDPSAFLPIVSFTLTSFSPPFAEQLMVAGLELSGKTDLHFTDTLYKVLRDVFHYKPILTKQQFLQLGFSQRKISVICDIINLVLQKHNQLKKPRVKCPGSHKDGRGDAHPKLTDADAASLVSKGSFVMNHIKNPSSTYPACSSHAEAFFSHNGTCASHSEVYFPNSPENGITELQGRKEEKENILNSPEVEGRLSALEAQLENVLSGLNRISVLEKRLEELERQKNTDKNEGQVITISRESWENLMSRVLLLETKLQLSSTQFQDPQPCQSSTSCYSSSSMPDASKGDLKDRLQRITNMLKSTSSLLKNTESLTTPQ